MRDDIDVMFNKNHSQKSIFSFYTYFIPRIIPLSIDAPIYCSWALADPLHRQLLGQLIDHPRTMDRLTPPMDKSV